MLTYKSYYKIAPPYLCELNNKNESHVNTPIIISLLFRKLVRIVLTLFLNFHYAAPCEWNKLSDISVITFVQYSKVSKASSFFS